MTLLDFNWFFSERWKTNLEKNWNPVFFWIRETSTFGAKSRKKTDYSIVFLFFRNNRHQTLKNTTFREGRTTRAGKHVLPGGNRAFLAGDRQIKCLGGDRQRVV
jgi:hypothetical protein